MTLARPFFVYGTATNRYGEPVVGATISVGTATATTNSVGKYQLNIENVSTDGETVSVNGNYRTKTSSNSFTVDLDDLGKSLNIQIMTAPRIKLSYIKGKKLSIINTNKNLSICRI